ncbi:F-box/kelch-repeat protein At3g23880-like [Bidens hawaiensis]|uniref:F-box/kelch-repeat protein At3g23880-like n=1 Tax=Bidens hawaiensis TaxID=980011 RepID=UPI00404B49BD
MAELSSKNIHDIFSRMLVKSLARFRCVSKQFRNYINDPYLETLHAKQATSSTDSMLIMFHQFASDLPNSQCIINFLEHKEETGGCTQEVTKKPPVMDFMCLKLRSNVIILGSCNGLLYSSQRRHRDAINLVVINPLRKECHELPPMKATFHYVNKQKRSRGIDLEESSRLCIEEPSGLGFDESTNTFKMACVALRKQDKPPNFDQLEEDLCTMVHVLGTDSWRKIPQVPSFLITGEGVFLKGCLHWLISDAYDDDREAYLGRTVITFDTAKEEFGVINPPQELPTSGWVREQLVDLHGELGYVYQIVNRGVEVWVLKERGWVLHCQFEHEPPLLYGFVKVLGLWNENGDVLMIDIGRKMLVYNLKSRGLYEVCFDGWEEEAVIDIRLYQSSLFSTRYSLKN